MRHERRKNYISCPLRRRFQEEYGVSLSAINNRVRLYSTVKTEDGEILTAKQVKAMQKRLLQLEEENLILKKAIAFLHAGQHKIKTLCRVLRRCLHSKNVIK